MGMKASTGTRTIGQLCIGGDWACSNGDLETLGLVARDLATHMHEPLRSELVALAELCRDDPDHAVSVWMRLEKRALADRRRPGG